MKEITAKMNALIDKLPAVPERGVLANFLTALKKKIQEREELDKEIFYTLDWMVAQLTWRANEQRQNTEEGSQGGYSEELTNAINLVDKLRRMK